MNSRRTTNVNKGWLYHYLVIYSNSMKTILGADMGSQTVMRWTMPNLSVRFFFFAVTLGLLIAVNQVAAGEYEFPYRDQFAAVGVQTIELEELAANFDDYIIVDARERFEYDTIHIQGAYAIPFSSREFSRQVRALAREHNKPLVFYCNGRECSVAYRAAEYALGLGIEGAKAYDLGILPWAKARPGQTILFGQLMTERSDGLISDAQFRERTLPQSRFFELIEQTTDPLVIDVRSNRQRDGISLYFGDIHLPLDSRDEEIMAVVDQAIEENRTVFVIDDAGHQIRWVQHAFEERGLANYWFLDGGAVAVFESMR